MCSTYFYVGNCRGTLLNYLELCFPIATTCFECQDDAAGTCVLDAPVAAVRGSAVSERFRGAWRSVIDAIHITYRGPDGQEIPAGSANAAQPGGTGEKP